MILLFKKATFINAIGGLLAVCALSAVGHARWDPQGLVQPRSERDDIKTGPCGSARTDSAVTLVAGSSVNLQFERSIYHQGTFRIAFSPANDQNFEQYILADNIPDLSNRRFYSTSVTLPDMVCESCTLQLIQVMRDRNPPTNYYSCADIRLVRESQPDTQAPGPVSQVLAIPGDTSVQLSWRNPADTDLAGILIAESNNATVTEPQAGSNYEVGDALGAGQIVFVGAGENVVLAERMPGTTYYYHLFAFDQSANYSADVTTDVTLAEELINVAPNVKLIAEQNGQITQTVQPDDGLVIVQTQISDANDQDSHQLIWTTSDEHMLDLDTVAEQFTFNPQGLPPTNYQLQVRVTDNGVPPLTQEANLSITVERARGTVGGGAGHFSFGFLILILVGFHRFGCRKGRQN